MKSVTTQTQAYTQPFIFLASPIAWAVYFVLVYLLVEMACGIGVLRGVVPALTLILMLPTLAVIIYAGRRGWMNNKIGVAQADVEDNSEVNGLQMQQFTAQVGIWLSGLFVLLTLAVGGTALVLMPC